jgi:hypothetical protein
MATSARPAICAAAAVALLAAAGCRNYFLGSTLPPDLHTISVPTFANRSGEPDIESSVTRAVLQEFQRDGALRLAPGGEGDIELTGAVVSSRLDPVRYTRSNRLATDEYRLILRAEVTAKVRATGRTLFNGVVEGDTLFRAAGDLNTARRTAMAPATRDLAHEVVNAVLSAW